MLIVNMASPKVKTIMKKINISILIFIVLISGFSNLWAQESALTSSLQKPYSLDDLYRIALKRSEKIKISEEDLYIAERTKEKALSVLEIGRASCRERV